MYTVNELKEIANQIRMLTISSIYLAQSGHPGGSLSIAELLTVLYFDEMNMDPQHPEDRNRDRLILSKGHGAPAYYAALALRGYFDIEECKQLRKNAKGLQGHPSMNKTRGVDYSTGSLGQGLSIANGMAIYGKRANKEYRVFCICGDGELQEGQIWEAVMSSAQYQLNNIVLFVDVNGLQIDGYVRDIMDHTPLAEKFKAFHWNVYEINGNCIEEIQQALKKVTKNTENPTCILAHTIKGKGVSYMENQVGWHGTAPDIKQYELAMKELKGACHHE